MDKAPYDRRGNMLGYVPRRSSYGYNPSEDTAEWRDNTPFEAHMTFDTFSRGMSSAKFVLRDQLGHRYEMFMKDMLDLVQQSTINHGTVYGHWKICKRGQNYGLQYVKV